MAHPLRAGASSSAVIFYPSARVFHSVENTGLISQHFAWGFLPRLFASALSWFFAVRFQLFLSRMIRFCNPFLPPAFFTRRKARAGLLRRHFAGLLFCGVGAALLLALFISHFQIVPPP